VRKPGEAIAMALGACVCVRGIAVRAVGVPVRLNGFRCVVSGVVGMIFALGGHGRLRSVVRVAAHIAVDEDAESGDCNWSRQDVEGFGAAQA
jgi:hypothetical protein